MRHIAKCTPFLATNTLNVFVMLAALATLRIEMHRVFDRILLIRAMNSHGLMCWILRNGTPSSELSLLLV